MIKKSQVKYVRERMGRDLSRLQEMDRVQQQVEKMREEKLCQGAAETFHRKKKKVKI